LEKYLAKKSVPPLEPPTINVTPSEQPYKIAPSVLYINLNQTLLLICQSPNIFHVAIGVLLKINPVIVEIRVKNKVKYVNCLLTLKYPKIIKGIKTKKYNDQNVIKYFLVS
jgi:hypothetical protein